MLKIGLVVDEGADLPKSFIEQNQIVTVPIKMEWPDLDPLPGQNTLEKMREAEKRGIKSFGKTSQPSPKDFLDAYKKQLEKFDQIIVITVTSKLSGTYNSALQAKNILGEEGKKIEVVDTLSATAGEAITVLNALDLINKGLSLEEIVKELNRLVPLVKVCALIEDPKWLETSGRLKPAIADWIRKMKKLNVRPLIGFKEGVLKAIGIKTGVKDVPTALFKEFESKTKNFKDKKIRVLIVHADNPERADSLKEMVEKSNEKVEIKFTNIIDDVLGILVGPDALVISWIVLD